MSFDGGAGFGSGRLAGLGRGSFPIFSGWLSFFATGRSALSSDLSRKILPTPLHKQHNRNIVPTPTAPTTPRTGIGDN